MFPYLYYFMLFILFVLFALFILLVSLFISIVLDYTLKNTDSKHMPSLPR